jgi:hypothetical protein
MTITLMLLLSNSHLLACDLPKSVDLAEPQSGFVTARLNEAGAARRYGKPEIEVRRVEEERPYAL